MVKVSLHALALIFLVTGCAGRTAFPVGTTQVGDQDLSCAQLQAETSRNEYQAQVLYEQHKKAGDANIAIGVVGAVLFWPALFALDTGTAEKDEAHALEARNAHLRFLSERKNCATMASNPRPTASPAAPVVTAAPLSSTPRLAAAPSSPAATPMAVAVPAVAPAPLRASEPAVSASPASAAGGAEVEPIAEVQPPPLSDFTMRRLASLKAMLDRRALTPAEYERKRLAALAQG